MTSFPRDIGNRKFIEDHLFDYTRTREGFLDLASLSFTPGWQGKVNIFKIYDLSEAGKAEFLI